MTEAAKFSRRPPQTKIGVVVSDKMEKTVVVEVERTVKDRRYQKYLKRSRKFMVHDEEEAASVGDRVLIEETRPLSRQKRWRLREILVTAQG